MPTGTQNLQVVRANLGWQVSRATAALPAGVKGSIFTITGGRILVRLLVGEVTTVLGATVTSLVIGNTPTVGNAVANSLATTAVVTSAPVGTHFVANPGGALVLDITNQNGVAAGAGYPFLCPAGAIDITPTATDTGSVKWDLWYLPIDPGASVVAA
jgi:hypothetical protein